MKIDPNISKAGLGTIGEMMVAANIISQGNDAILANMTINNIARYDLVCVNKKTGCVALVQVKSSVEKNFPVGFKIKEASSSLVDEKIVGPWVFVYVDNSKPETEFQYYILSRKEVNELIKKSNCWYQQLHYRAVPVNENNAVSLRLDWLKGNGLEKIDNKYEAFDNPLKGVSSKDKWEKLWEE